MSNENFATRLERAFVELVDRRSESKGYLKKDFAALVWPEISPKASASRWTTIRSKATHTGRPQGVTIADAHRIAEVLGEDLSYLLAVAKENAKKQA